MSRLWRAVHQRAEVWSLVLLALIPSLASSPGRMPGDTKLYLYLDPGRLVSDARWSWDSRQFGGWVPHQTISYLWPSGPWFAAWDALGVADWVAHRLWLATLLATAGLGARWAARHLGITGSAAWVVGAVYQLSPFVLPYVSRTSLMLVGYSSLGWLVGLTVRSALRGGWRHPALFALVVATVAAPNATATAMIAPAPVLWLLIAAASRQITWRRAASCVATLGGLSLAVSVWWISMLSVQGRYGADVLGYSETLEDVSLTATSTEVLRGLGYWLFYVRDAFSYATTASIDYQASTRTVITSLTVTGLGIAGLALTRWTQRSYAVALVAVGTILAVGVYPIDDPSPLMSPLADRSRSAVALALRSSTRALPLVILGLALGAGAVVMASSAWLARRRSASATPRWPAVAVVLLAVANLPALWRADLVDPALERDQDPPAAWHEAAELLDRRSGDHRVLQLPGAEFGAFRWGYTVDPPLPGLTTRPLITRDLLPLGSPGAMDLLYALDDRVQEGVVEPASVAPVARLLAADVVWLANDAAFDRFGTARPEPLSQTLTAPDTGLGPVTNVGTPQVNLPVRPSLDAEALADPVVGAPFPPVQLIDVPRPIPLIRAGVDVVALAGSGDGVVDAAAAGLLDDTSVLRYVASLADDERGVVLAEASRVIVTDTDRRRAHHWRSSQDVWGFTEDDHVDGGVLNPATGDRRLPVFPPEAADQQTIARQQGGLRASASRYGPPFSYHPERRAWRAVDGDLTSSWTVGDGADPRGERLRLEASEAVDHLVVVQPLEPGRGRWITQVELVLDGSPVDVVTLDATSRTATGQRITFERRASTIELIIVATETLGPGWEHLDPVGFAEVTSGLPPSDETVVLRSPALTETPAQVPVDIVLTRWRTSPYDALRADPEPMLDRTFALGEARTLEPRLTVRLNRRAADQVIADLIGWDGAVSDRRLTGDLQSGGWAALDGDPTTAWRTPFDAAVGARWTAPLATAPDGPVGRSLRLTQVIDGRHALITELDVQIDDGSVTTVAVPPPDTAGASIVDLGTLGDSLDDPTARRLTLTVRSTNGATTLDRVSALPVGLPIGILSVEHERLVAQALPTTLSATCRDDVVEVNGTPWAVTVEGDLGALLRGAPVDATLCDNPTAPWEAGNHRIRTAPGLVTGIDVDRIVLTDARPRWGSPRPEVTVLERSRTLWRLEVAPCPRGCWLVHGEGFNLGWSADGPTGGLGPPQLVDGGMNGWWLEPSDAVRSIELTWQPQRTVDAGLLVSLLAVAICLGLVIADRRRPMVVPSVAAPVWASWRRDTALRPGVAAMAVAVFTMGVATGIEPAWGLLTGAFAALMVVCRRPALMGVAAIGLAAVLGVLILWRVRQDRPVPGPLWTAEFADLHRPGLVVVALLVGSLVAAGRAR